MEVLRLRICVLAVAVGLPLLHAQAMQLEKYRVGGGGRDLFRQHGELILRDREGHFLSLSLSKKGIERQKLRNFRRDVPSPPKGALPDTVVSQGAGAIRRAWFVDPTDRYGHGVLGDAIEAGGLAIERANGEIVRLTLPESSVFEDRWPRLWDVDGDGDAEVVVVRAYLNAGAALAVVDLVDGRPVIVAETPPIGRANRWLNPVGAGDFDGDGQIEVAYVETPHIGGVLRLFRLTEGRLVQAYAARGFSNHAIGSRRLRESISGDFDNDGVAEILIPDAAQRLLRHVDFKDGELRQRGRYPIQGRIASDFFLFQGPDKKKSVIFLLANGELAIVSL